MIFENFSWVHIIYLLLTTHITILTVTIYLHRSVAHRSVTLAKPIEHFFRFWCWITTGQTPQEWAAVHRKHHAFCEQEQDPHSPRHYGFWTVLFQGVTLYRNESKNPETIEKYGKFTPNDWIENKLYKKYTSAGLVSLAFINVFLFGMHGIWIYLLQILWIPFWAAGIINGLAHVKGYRNFNTEDDSTNILPWGIIIGGEELHNNHHAYPTSAKLSMQWYEFDIGWFWINLLSKLGLAKVNKVVRLPVLDKTQKEFHDKSLDLVLANRHFVWKLFKSKTSSEVKSQLMAMRNEDILLKKYSIKQLKNIFYEVATNLSESQTVILTRLLTNEILKKVYEVKEALSKMWSDRQSNYAQLKEALHALKEKAYHSGNQSIQDFSLSLVWLKASH
jgi:stearoyl-CoA desaturase (delta-9 desaturase)